MKRLVLGSALGALLAYVVARRAAILERFNAGDGTAKQYDDVTLARKVETEIFRERDAPKGKIDVNVVDGVVELRGEADTPEMIEELVAKTRSVQGVRDVENLLHLPGEPAPMHQ